MKNDSNDKLLLLYEASAQKFDNLGTYAEFSEKMRDDKKRKLFYDAAAQKFDNLGTYDEFDTKIQTYLGGIPPQPSFSDVPENLTVQQMDSISRAENAKFGTEFTTAEPQEKGFWGKVEDFFAQGFNSPTINQYEQHKVDKEAAEQKAVADRKAFAADPYRNDDIARSNEDITAGKYKPKEEKSDQDIFDNQSELFRRTPDGAKAYDKMVAASESIQQRYIDLYAKTPEFAKLRKQYQEQVAAAVGDDAKAEVTKRFNELLGRRLQERYGEDIDKATRNAQAEYFETMYKARQQSYEGAREKLYAPIVKEKNENLLANVTDELTAARKQISDKANALSGDRGSHPYPSASVWSQNAAFTNLAEKENPELASEKRMLETAQERLKENKQVIDAAINGSGFWKAMGESFNADNWTMGLNEYMNSSNVRKVIEKSEKGEELTKAEQAVMDAVSLEVLANQYYAYQHSRTYKMGQTTGASLPFMVDFMINPFSGTGRALAKAAMKWGVKRGLVKGGVRALTIGARAGGDILGATGMTATSGLGRVAAGVEQRMTGDVNADISYDKELGTYDINYLGRENNQTFGTALWNSAADQWIENYSEMALNVFEGGGKQVKQWIKHSPLNGLSNSKAVQGAKYLWSAYDKLQKRAQFHGYLGEVSEEYLGNLLRLGVTTDTNAEDVFSADAQIDTWLGLLPTSIAFAGIGAAGRGINKYNRNKASKQQFAQFLDMLSPDERKTFDIMQQHINNGETDFAKDYIKNTLSDHRLSAKEKRDRLEAVYAVMYDKQYDDFMNSIRNEREMQFDKYWGRRVADDGTLTIADMGEQSVSVIRQNDDGTYHIIDAQGNESDVQGNTLSNVESTSVQSQEFLEMRKRQVDESIAQELAQRRYKAGDKITNGEYEGEITALDGKGVTIRFDDGSTTTIPYTQATDEWCLSADKKIDDAAAEIDKQANTTNGHVTNVRVSGEKGTSYVKSGNLVIAESNDGKPIIDKDKSDKTFVVVNADTGEAKQVGIDQITEVLGDAAQEELKQQSNESIRQATYNETNYPTGSIVYNEQMPNGFTSIVGTDEQGINIQSLNEQTKQVEQTSIPNDQRNTWHRLKLDKGNVLQTQLGTIEIIENNGANGYVVSIDGGQPQRIGAQELADKLTAEQFDVEAYEAEYGQAEQQPEPQQGQEQAAGQEQNTGQEQPAGQQQQGQQKDEGAEYSDEDVNATVTDIFRKLQRQKELAAKPISLIDDKAVAKREAAKQEVERLQQLYDYWNGIKQRREEVKTAAAQQRKAETEAERQRREAEKAAQAEAERIEREKAQGVPDVSRDNAKDARKRGYRIESGRVIERQMPVRGLYGKGVEVMFSEKDRPQGRVKVVEAEQLQPSHINGKRNNRYFITEAQPKERTDKASQVAAENIAKHIVPQQITEGTTAYQGAPVINTRGEVIQGNNRTTALRLMYDMFPEQAAQYKQYLIYNAEKFGLNADEIAAMERPVLTTELDVSDEEAIRLGQKNAQDTESGGRQRIDSEKTAQMLGNKLPSFAQRLTQTDEEDMPLTDVVAMNGKNALKYLTAQNIINDTQYQSAFNKNGELTPEAKADLLGVVENMLFAGAKTDQIRTMFAALPQTAQKAILQTIARDAANSNDAKVTPYLQEAIEAFYSVKDDVMFGEAKTFDEYMRAIDSWARQSQMDFAGNAFYPVQKYSNFALALAATFKSQTMATQRAKYNELYDKLQGKGANLFGEAETLTFSDAVEKVYNVKLNRENRQDVTDDGSDVLALGSEPSSQRQHGGTAGTRSAEQTAAGEPAADHTAGTATHNGQSQTTGSAQTADISASDTLKQIEAEAVPFEEIELTPANWYALFGEDGIVGTPIGNVKMGEHQYLKLAQKGRDSKLGMIKPTLEHPSVVVEDKSQAKDGQTTEREFSYVFVKAFIGKNGERLYYFTSITVSKDGREVVVSNQEKERSRIQRLLKNGKLAYINKATLPPASDKTIQGDQLTNPVGDKATLTELSDGKGTANVSHTQAPKQKSSLSAEKAADTQRLEQERRERILREGTSFDKAFGLVAPKDITSPQQITDNIQAIVEGLALAEKALGEKGNSNAADTTHPLHDFSGWVYGEGHNANAQHQIEGYLTALDVLDPAITNEWQKQTGLKTYGDLRKYVEKIYNKAKAAQINDQTLLSENESLSANQIVDEVNKTLGTYYSIDDGKITDEQLSELQTLYADWQNSAEADKDKNLSRLKQKVQDIQYAQEMSVQDMPALTARINDILGDYASRKMAFLQVEELLNRNVELAKKFLDEHNIKTLNELKTWCGKQQNKLRAGNGKQLREARAQIAVDHMLDMAQQAAIDEKEKQRVDAFVEKMTGKGVHLVQDARQLPHDENTAYRAIKSGLRVMGWFNPKTEQVYIYTPNARNYDEVMRTLLHEFVAHKGLRDMLGAKEFDKLCRNVWKMMPFEQRVQFAVYVKQRIPVGTRAMQDYIAQLSPYDIAKLLGDEKTQLAAADEYMAHFAEKGVTKQNRSIWQQIADAIRKMLRKMGFDVKLQDRDIARLLYESRNRLTQDMTLEEMVEAAVKLNAPTNGFKQTPKNTSLDDVLFSIKVNHNSPFLLKRADGSFIDKETGERLGFDHRFMGKGEGAQVHGWGSYFSVNDLRKYSENGQARLQPNEQYSAENWFDHDKITAIKPNGWAVAKIATANFERTGTPIYEYLQSTIDELKKAADEYRADGNVKAAENTEKDLSLYEAALAGYTGYNLGRHHYDVEIPDNDGTNYLEKQLLYRGEKREALLDKIEKALVQQGFDLDKEYHHKASWNEWRERLRTNPKFDTTTGEDIYDKVSNMFESWDGDEEASKLLKKAGIVGIHYFGRQDGECYVIFDENDATITDHTLFSIAASEQNDKEMRAIAEQAKADGTYMQAPNGEPTNLNERQWLQVRTNAFKKWFGDWNAKHEAEVELPNRLAQWLSKENIERAQGKSRAEIIKEFGNEPQAIAYIPMQFLPLVDTHLQDNRVYSGMGYFIDHAVNHHPNIAAEKYLNIQEVLNAPDEVKAITDNGNHSIVFIKQIDRYNAVVIEVENTDDGRIVWHKSFYDQNKKPYANKGTRLYEMSSEGGVSSIIRTGEPAHDSSLSVLDDAAKVEQISDINKSADNFLRPDADYSQFIDENGEPKVFYHNTNNQFSIFDSQRNGTSTDAGWLGDGFYFYGDYYEGNGYGQNKMAVFLNVREPYYATSAENNYLAEANSREASVEFRERIEDEGYDGVYYNGDLRQEAVVFSPNQIKSATNNNGSFNESSDDIRFSIASAEQVLSKNASHQSKRFAPENDDDIRFSISKRNEMTIDNLLAKNTAIGEQEAAAFKRFVDEYPPVAQLAMARWYGEGNIRLPEDKPLADQALKICNKTKKDPLSYASAGEICEEYRKQQIDESAPKRELLSPDAYPDVLTNKTDYGNGIVVYDVADSQAGRQAVRDLMNDHLGKSVSPWCVLYADNNGVLTDHSMEMWKHYDGTQRKVALYNGEVVSFCASEDAESEWWDLSDKSHGTAIPVESKIPNDKMGRTGTLEFNPETGELTQVGRMHLGNKKEGKYYEWNEDGHLWLEETYKHERLNGITRVWYPNGQLKTEINYKNGECDGVFRTWYKNGQQSEEINYKNDKYDGVRRTWYENGQLKSEANSKNNVEDGVRREWYVNGQLLKEEHYKDGELDGVRRTWYDNGQQATEINYKDGEYDGVHRRWYKNGQLCMDMNYKDGDIDGIARQWYENGQLLEEMNYKNGLLDGTAREWEEDGQLYSEINYKDGIIDGVRRKWNSNGQLIEEENYKNGIIDGVRRTWYDNGQQATEINYKDGEYDGVHRRWYKNGQLCMDMNYKDGDIDGIARQWYENGQLLEEENYKNGLLDGTAREWEQNGQLYSEINYKNGEQVQSDPRFSIGSENRTAATPAQSAATQAVLDMLEKAGIEVEQVSDEEARQELAKQSNAELMAVTEQFNDTLNRYTDENADNIKFNCGMPSEALLLAGMPNVGIRLNGEVLRKKMKAHQFAKEDVRNLPLYMQNPIAVFNGSHDNTFAVLTEMLINGRNTLVAIDIKGAEIQDFVEVSSLYDKNRTSVINWINDGKLLSVDKEKALRYIDTDAPIAPTGNNKGANSAAKIVQDFDTAKSFVGKNADTPQFSVRTTPAPKKTGIGYKVFYRGKDGKLYPPMVANPNGADTPVGVWLNADAAPITGESKTGRPQVKAGGKGTQGGSGQLAYRPGWHLGEIPYALQFNRKDADGNRTLFPKDFVWAEVEYAADNNYQQEAEQEGYTDNGKYRHSYAGLKHLPTDGFYRYRTNPNPETDPWIITGAMKVNRVLSNEEVDEIVRRAGRQPQKREFLQTSDGTIYGYAKGGKIYLTARGLNPNTPIHEYTHLWDTACQRANPELWKRGVELMKQLPLWEAIFIVFLQMHCNFSR